MSVQIPRFAEPFSDKGVEVSGPHRGVAEANLARQTLTAAYYMSGTKHHYGAIVPMTGTNVDCPIANITTVDTWTDFSYTISAGVYEQVEYPYRVTEGFTKIMAVFDVVSDVLLDYAVRVSSKKLVDVVATVDGAQSMSTTPSEDLIEQKWKFLSYDSTQGFYNASFVCFLVPTLPANRRISIVPSIKLMVSRYANFDLSASTFGHVYLRNLILLDTHETG